MIYYKISIELIIGVPTTNAIMKSNCCKQKIYIIRYMFTVQPKTTMFKLFYVLFICAVIILPKKYKKNVNTKEQ